jgi:hypothetical protein
MSKNPGKSKPTLAILGYYLAILAPYEDNLFPSEDKIAPNIQYIHNMYRKRVAWANTLSKLRTLCGG